MRFGRSTLVVVVLTLAVAGCGSSGHASTQGKTKAQASASQSTATPPGPPPSGPPPSGPPAAPSGPLAQRVLRNGELAGMSAQPTPITTGAAAWAANQQLSGAARKIEEARLRRLGFVAALAENTLTPTNSNRFGLSLVEQLASPRSALAELAYSTGPSSQGAPWTYFAVPGIPGARGFEGGGSNGGGRNVAFTDGRFYYVVGDGWNGPKANALTHKQLIAAAQLLYRRVHALPGG